MFQKAALFTGKLLFAYIGYLNWLCPLASTTSKVSTREVGWKKQDKTKQNNKQKNIFMGTWIGKWPPLNTRNLFNIDFHLHGHHPHPSARYFDADQNNRRFPPKQPTRKFDQSTGTFAVLSKTNRGGIRCKPSWHKLSWCNQYSQHSSFAMCSHQKVDKAHWKWSCAKVFSSRRVTLLPTRAT